MSRIAALKRSRSHPSTARKITQGKPGCTKMAAGREAEEDTAAAAAAWDTGLTYSSEDEEPSTQQLLIAKAVVKLLTPTITSTVEKAIQDSMQKLRQDISAQNKRLSEFENRLSAVEDEITFLHTSSQKQEKSAQSLIDKIEDLENRSRRNNLRVIGLPESCTYIIAGSLTIAAQAKSNVCLIKGSLSLNIISCIFSMIAVILNLADLVHLSLYNWCNYVYNYYGNASYGWNVCQKLCLIQSLLFVINLLLFCVTISSSIYGCRSLSKVQTIIQVFVMQNDVSFGTNPSAIPATYSQPPYQPQYPVNAFGASPSYY